MSKEEVNNSEKKDKKKILIIVLGVILLLVIVFLLWFFNRKFDVVFDLNNGTENNTILVKYNKTVDEKDIKDKDELGESFIDWYQVIDVKDNEDVLADEPFDFNTKIKSNIKLKAVYEGEVETITITFDSRGGSKVNAITINKGAELTLPKNPTYSGYKFINWETENKTPVYDKALLSEDVTLYAKWEKVVVKVETPKKEEVKEETPKQEEPKPEETISLSISNSAISRYGTIKTSKATANVQNSSNSQVTYSLSDTICAKIDSSTGLITALNESEMSGGDIQICEQGKTVTVKATLPSGKSASVKLNIEKDLYAHFNNRFIATNGEFEVEATNNFTIVANQNVTWTATSKSTGSSTVTYAGKTSSTPTTFVGNLKATYTSASGKTSTGYPTACIKLETPAGQSFTITAKPLVN